MKTQWVTTGILTVSLAGGLAMISLEDTGQAAQRIDPSGVQMPVGDLPGWHQVFSDNFPTNVPEGTWTGCVTGSPVGDCSGLPQSVRAKWWSYPDGWPDTSRNGVYQPSQVNSIKNGTLRLRLHRESTGKALVSAPYPKIPGAPGSEGGLLYGRYAIRFKVSSPTAGYKIAWLLWPDSETWPRDGEIDFPEGSLNGTISAFMHRMNGTSGSDQDAYNTGVSVASGWHTSVTEWGPDHLKFYLDGRLVGDSRNRIPSTPMHWVIQSETDTNGTAPAPNSQATIYIDWATAYERV